jgi:L-alanine-DL-glutamate epimerase-like enolase superfamily enzyme
MPRAAAPAGTQNTGPALLGGVHHEKRENRDGVIEVLQEPGAGLELDWQQAEKYRFGG